MEAYCTQCSRPGHLPRACRMKKYPTKDSRRVYWLAELDDSEESLRDAEVTVNQTSVVERPQSRTERCSGKAAGRSVRATRRKWYTQMDKNPFVDKQEAAVRSLQHDLHVRVEPVIMLPIE
ncbi:hypothetical protein Q1695_015175 [Nippostrongylus brasiliensis]|nr:hypothetical protein Q1695_015175 [Nippostrongylus brasiliensis]